MMTEGEGLFAAGASRLEPELDRQTEMVSGLIRNADALASAAKEWKKATDLASRVGLTALAQQAQQADELQKQARKLQGALKRWHKALVTGDIGAMEKAVRAAQEIPTPLADSVDAVARAWRFDVERYLADGSWLREISETAADKHSIRVKIEGDELICSPIALTARPQTKSLHDGKKGWSQIRPTIVAAEIRKARERMKDSRTQELLESLYAAWKARPMADAPIITLKQAYDTFSMAPGWKKGNSPAWYKEAVLALVKSDIQTTRDGTRFQLESPAASVKASEVLEMREEDGRVKRYVSIRFITK